MDSAASAGRGQDDEKGGLGLATENAEVAMDTEKGRSTAVGENEEARPAANIGKASGDEGGQVEHAAAGTEQEVAGERVVTEGVEKAEGSEKRMDVSAPYVNNQKVSVTVKEAPNQVNTEKEVVEEKSRNRNDTNEAQSALAASSEANGGEAFQLVENPPESMRKRSRSEIETFERRKRRRRLRRLLKEAGEFPSFVALISNVDTKDDEEEMKDDTPEIVVVDVDDYLGIKKADSQPARSNRKDNGSSALSVTTVTPSTPADEGYYEGRVPLSSPDDDQYLTSLQQLIRSHLEYFSATAADAAGSQAGRRYPIVQGKVGIRCVWCAKVALEHEAVMAAKLANQDVKPDKSSSAGNPDAEEDGADSNENSKPIDPSKIWPPGSVSYPLNVSGLYSICSQKPQLHFEQCPNLPPSVLAQFYRLTRETSVGETRVKSREVSAAQYYAIAAKRIGIVNVPGGIRFGRELKLEPLPLDAVLAQERQETDEMKVHHVQIPSSATPDMSAMASNPDAVGSSRIEADQASEQVLTEAIAEPDDQPNHLARASDRHYVSSFTFLLIRQMSVCRAVPADFATRGKKTRKMRIGFAGFCCRHCLKVREEEDGTELARAHGASGYSCRSFSSAPDNLASAISNSFAEHLLKCGNVPKRLRSALAVYKRLHPRMMSELPHGSQRRLFQDIWERVRAADVPEDEMNKRIREYKPGQPDPPVYLSAKEPPRPKPNVAKPDKVSSSKAIGRGSSKFPVSKDQETKNVLSRAEENWHFDPKNDLVFPGDRETVSDYLFLILRQLKVALPTAADMAKGRRGPATQVIMAGMCCKHCDGEDLSIVAPSGRSFPTAPDNYASAFNTSLYNHMQNCHLLSTNVKRALANLRKLHSQQIAKLKFGSQRRFFNLLFDRLSKVPLPDKLPKGNATVASSPRKPSRNSSKKNDESASRSRNTRRSESGDMAILQQFSFFEAPLQSFFCMRCRMVPLSFRARGSLSFAKPSLDFMSEHHESCKEDGFDLWFCVESLKEVLKNNFDIGSLTDPLFKEVVLECFGRNEQLASIFTSEIVKVYQMSKHGGVTRAVEHYVKAKSQGLWSQIPTTVDTSKVFRAFEKFAATVDGLSPRLTEHDALVKYLLLISPSLSLVEEEEENSDEGQEKESGEEVASEGESNPEDEEENGDEDYQENGITGSKPPKKRGKQLRRKEEDDIDDDDDEVLVVENPAQNRRGGKELRKKEVADTEEEKVTPRKQKGGKELKRKPKPMDDAVEDDVSTESKQKESVGDSELEGSQFVDGEDDSIGSGSIFEENEDMNSEVGNDADDLMKEGIDEEQELEVSREQMDLD